jgi:hypothetical protein
LAHGYLNLSGPPRELEAEALLSFVTFNFVVFILDLCIFQTCGSGPFQIIVPDWEWKTQFDPEKAVSQRREKVSWVTLDGTEPQLSAVWSTALQVPNGDSAPGDPCKLPLRDPRHFVAGNLTGHVERWEKLLAEFPECSDGYGR